MKITALPNPEIELKKCREEKQKLVGQKRAELRDIADELRRLRNERVEEINERYRGLVEEVDERIFFIKRSMAHAEAEQMLCDLTKVKPDCLGPLLAAIFGERSDGRELKGNLNELKQECIECLQSLTPRERVVLFYRFGLDGSPGQTCRGMGKRYGVSGDRIRQITEKALRKMRHPSRSRRLKDYLD